MTSVYDFIQYFLLCKETAAASSPYERTKTAHDTTMTESPCRSAAVPFADYIPREVHAAKTGSGQKHNFLYKTGFIVLRTLFSARFAVRTILCGRQLKLNLLNVFPLTSAARPHCCTPLRSPHAAYNFHGFFSLPRLQERAFLSTIALLIH